MLQAAIIEGTDISTSANESHELQQIKYDCKITTRIRKWNVPHSTENFNYFPFLGYSSASNSNSEQ